MRKYYLSLLSLLYFAFSGCANDKITLETLLDEMIDYDAIVAYPEYTCLQQSSYDRRSASPDAIDWWANDDGWGFIRTETNEGRTEKVLFEDTGAGVITRIWITTQNKTGTVRFYFDGSSSPNWTMSAYDFVKFGVAMSEGLCQPHTSYLPGITERGGSTFFFPIPYAEGCKMTLEEPDPNAKPSRYYGINYRKYPKGTKIETFSQAVATRAANKIALVDETLLNPPTYDNGNAWKNARTLSPEESITINLPEGKNAVRTIRFQVEAENPEHYDRVMRELILQTTFDAKATSWVPLGDFSGAGMGAPYVKSWYLDADGKGSIVSRWVMPYKETGAITLTNHSDEQVRVSMEINTAPFEWKDNTLYFHCSWKQERDIPLTPNGSKNSPDNALDWDFALIAGKGIYRGDVLSLFNYAPRWYGEGDEKIYIDDEIFPSHFGTGTEDYYNSSWAPVVPFHTPFGGAPRADKASSNGYNTFFRTRNLDAIPFAKKFKFDLEMISWDPGKVDYSTTIYWYGDYAAQAKGLSGLDEAKHPLQEAGIHKIADCIEFETYPFAECSSSFTVEIQGMSDFKNGQWSGDYQRLFKNGKANDYVSYRFEGLSQAKQQLTLYLTKANDFGILSFTINGQRSPLTFDGYSTNVTSSGPIDLGEHMPDKEGVIELKITLTGSNPNTQGYKTLIGLDCIQIKDTSLPPVAIGSVAPDNDYSFSLSADQLTVVSKKGIKLLSLYDTNGVLLLREKENDTLNVAGLSRGSYLLEVLWTDSGRSTMKL